MRPTAPSCLITALLLLVLSPVASAADDARIQALVEQYVALHAPRGGVIVGVLEHGERRWFSAGESGRADVALSPDTPFEIGSITKPIVAHWIAILVHAGALEWSTTVGELWPPSDDAPPLPNPEIAAITIEELLTHTSGLPRVRLSPFRFLRTVVLADDPYRGLSRTQVLRDAASVRISERGNFTYSNLGYALIGELVRRHSNDTVALEARLSAELLVPLGLDPVDLSRPGMDRSRFPQGFATNGRRVPPWTFDGYAAAGALVATPDFLLDLAAALLHADAPVQDAFRPRAPAGTDRSVGLGWILENTETGETIAWHNGGTGGFSSHLTFVPEQGVAVVALANSAVSVDELARAVLLGEATLSQPGPPPLPILLPTVGLMIAYWYGIVQLLFAASRTALAQVSRLAFLVVVVVLFQRSVPAALYHPAVGGVLALVGVGAAVGGFASRRRRAY